jgi:hypothetical protein
MLTKPVILLTIICIYSYTYTAPLEYDIEIKRSTGIAKEFKNQGIFLEDQYQALDLFRLGSTLYLINLNIGSPLQTFSVALDTGSFITWVADKEASGKLHDRTKYNPGVSKYYVKSDDKEIEYASFKIDGYIFSDVISFNDNPGQKPMKLLAGKNLTSPGMDKSPFDGLIGLGRNYDDKISQCNSEYSIIKNLYDQKLISKQIFSFQPVSEDKGKFYIGDYHADFNKDHAKCNLYKGTADAIWACRLSYILIGETTKETFQSKAYKQYQEFIIDSGSEASLAPESAYSYFEQNLFNDLLATGKCQKETKMFTDFFTCPEDFNFDNVPPVYFVLNGYALKISAKHLFLKNNNNFKGKLVFGILFIRGLNLWLMGQPLFYENHILFDYEKSLVAFSGDYKDFSEFTNDNDVDGNKDKDKKDEDKDKKDDDKSKDDKGVDKVTSSDKGIGIGWVFVIVITAVIAVVGIGLIIFCMCMNRKRRLAAQQMSSQSNLL